MLNRKIERLRKGKLEFPDSLAQKMQDFNKELVEFIAGEIVETVTAKLERKLRALQFRRCILLCFLKFWTKKRPFEFLRNCKECFQYFVLS